MNIINRRTVLSYADKYPKARNQLLHWYHELSGQDFENLNQVKEIYASASIIINQRVVFHITGSDYRLVVSINFRRNACYTIWFGTHKEYDQIDVATISYNPDF